MCGCGVLLIYSFVGHLVSDYLMNDISAEEYIANLSKEGHLYNTFNLILIEHR